MNKLTDKDYNIANDKLACTTALQSRAFAMDIQRRAELILPGVDMQVFGLEEVLDVDHNGASLTSETMNLLERKNTIKDFKKDRIDKYLKGIGYSEDERAWIDFAGGVEARDTFVESSQPYIFKEVDVYTGEVLGYEFKSKVILGSPKEAFVDKFANCVNQDKEDIVTNIKFLDAPTWAADHEIFHSYLHFKTFEAVKDNIPSKKLSNNREYSSYLHECGADLFGICSAIQDGADVKDIIDSVCALRTLGMINYADKEHFTTPVIESVRERIMDNLESIKHQTKEELAANVVDIIIGPMDDPENLTKDAIVPDNIVGRINECFDVMSSGNTFVKSMTNRTLRPDESISQCVTMADVVAMKEHPELHENIRVYFVEISELYVEPYQHVFHTQKDIDNGFVKQFVETEISKGEDTFYSFQEKYLLPLYEKERGEKGFSLEDDLEWEMMRFERALDAHPEFVGLDAEQDIEDARNAMNAYKQFIMAQDVELEGVEHELQDDEMSRA